MTEQEHIELLRAALAREGEDLIAIEGACAAAIGDHPRSAGLWCLHGDVLGLMHDPHTSGPPTEALACYRRATELDPSFAEPWEEIGWYLDTHEDALVDAEAAFGRAIDLGAPASARLGLARVLAQRGERDAALHALKEAESANGDPGDIEAMRAEIRDGIWNSLRDC